MRRLIFVCSSVVLMVLAVLPVQAKEPPAQWRNVAAVLQQQVDNGEVPGAVLQVTRGGRVAALLSVGHLDREANVAMPVDAIFRIASQTKAVVSVAIMMLQERGQLLIGDAVARYLPEYAATTVAVADESGAVTVVPAIRPITLRDLLTHTAGIDYGNGPAAQRWEAAGIQGWYFAHRTEPIRETVRRMAALPFAAQPGTRFVYGYNTDILGAVVEVVSGQPLDAFLREQIFEPLGMVDTSFYLPPAKRGRLAVVYGNAADAPLVRAPDTSSMVGQGEYVDGPRTSFSGGAGLLSTAADYSRFLEALRDGGRSGKVRLLGRKTVELMTANHLGDVRYAPGAGFGLGFALALDLGRRGVPGSVGEYGWGGAYHTSYWVDPAEELVVIYMTQVRPAVGLSDTAKLRAAIYAALP